MPYGDGNGDSEAIRVRDETDAEVDTRDTNSGGAIEGTGIEATGIGVVTRHLACVGTQYRGGVDNIRDILREASRAASTSGIRSAIGIGTVDVSIEVVVDQVSAVACFLALRLGSAIAVGAVCITVSIFVTRGVAIFCRERNEGDVTGSSTLICRTPATDIDQVSFAAVDDDS
jgi:hypothetical protein